MSSQARVAANRRNAAKSTGPRTTEGKAVVAQNAVKHGLWARQAVLRNEDPQEFELHRTRMLQKLAPDGPEEEAMAERIVALWWRLKRAERMQDEALDYLIEADRRDGWVKCRREDGDPSARAELAFGRVVARDFAETRTLDRLSMHERRIESSLYRTMKELRHVRREQEGQDGHGASSAHNLRNHDGWQRQAQPAELDDATREGTRDCVKQSQSGAVSSLKCEVPSGAGAAAEDRPSRETKPMEGGISSLRCQVSSSDPALQTSHLKLDAFGQAPCGVTTNAGSDAKQSQWRGPAAGVVLRTRPRVAYRYHNVASSC